MNFRFGLEIKITLFKIFYKKGGYITLVIRFFYLPSKKYLKPKIFLLSCEIAKKTFYQLLFSFIVKNKITCKAKLKVV